MLTDAASLSESYCRKHHIHEQQYLLLFVALISFTRLNSLKPAWLTHPTITTGVIWGADGILSWPALWLVPSVTGRHPAWRCWLALYLPSGCVGGLREQLRLREGHLMRKSSLINNTAVVITSCFWPCLLPCLWPVMISPLSVIGTCIIKPLPSSELSPVGCQFQVK